MSVNARINTVTETISRDARNIQYPQKNGKPQWISEIFGQNVFSLREMSKRMPKPLYSTFLKQIRGNEIIDKTTADAIAHAVKVWAMEHGATHFTHWFQPQTDSTAEKHDSFLTLKSTFSGGYEEVWYWFYFAFWSETRSLEVWIPSVAATRDPHYQRRVVFKESRTLTYPFVL